MAWRVNVASTFLRNLPESFLQILQARLLLLDLRKFGKRLFAPPAASDKPMLASDKTKSTKRVRRSIDYGHSSPHRRCCGGPGHQCPGLRADPGLIFDPTSESKHFITRQEAVRWAAFSRFGSGNSGNTTRFKPQWPRPGRWRLAERAQPRGNGNCPARARFRARRGHRPGGFRFGSSIRPCCA